MCHHVRHQGDGTGGEGAEHQDASEQGKKKETDLQRIYNTAVSIMRGNQETEGRGVYDTEDRRRDDDSRGTGARSGSKTPDDDVSRGQRHEGSDQYKPSRSGSGESIVNRHIRSKYENKSGTGQSIVNMDGRLRTIFEEEQEETTDPLNTAFDDSNDSDASTNGTSQRRNRGTGGI